MGAETAVVATEVVTVAAVRAVAVTEEVVKAAVAMVVQRVGAAKGAQMVG